MLVIALIITLVSGSAFGATEESIDRLAEQLMSIRSSIEGIHSEMEEKSQTFRSKMQSLNVAKSDLVAMNQREELRIKELQQNVTDIESSLEEKFIGGKDMAQLVHQTASKIKTHMENSLPFKKAERIKTVDDMILKLDSKQISPYRAANRVWGFIEDEIRLQKDIGLYKQVIKVDGEQQLCDLAKIGMLTFYFQSANHKFGLMKKKDDKWIITLVEDEQGKREIQEMFSLLKKQIRVGVFNFPKFI